MWLRLEGVAALAAAVTAYAAGGYSWPLFALLFLAPDVTLFAYLAGPKAGAYCYNAAHTYAVPLAAGVVLHLLGNSTAVPLVWAAHIGLDRLLGYGLKYPEGFSQTHLGHLGGGARKPMERTIQDDVTP